MSDTPLYPENEEEKKRRERQAFEQFFIKQRTEEEKRNKSIVTWVIIIGVGVPFVLSILYVIVWVAIMLNR